MNDYFMFCERFVPCVIGKISVRNALGQGKSYSQYCTSSDETMALLVYANNYEYWLAKCENRETMNKQKYFNEGRGKGNTFNIEGRMYFNKMHRLCLESRKNRIFNFDELFKEYLIQSKTMYNKYMNGKKRDWEDDPEEESKYHRIVRTKDLEDEDKDIYKNAPNRTEV